MTVASHLARRCRKVSRETDLPVLIGAVEHSANGSAGAHVQVASATPGEIEFIALGVLRMLENDLTEAAATCDECGARWRRVSAAAAILAEGFGHGGPVAKGSC